MILHSTTHPAFNVLASKPAADASFSRIRISFHDQIAKANVERQSKCWRSTSTCHEHGASRGARVCGACLIQPPSCLASAGSGAGAAPSPPCRPAQLLARSSERLRGARAGTHARTDTQHACAHTHVQHACRHASTLRHPVGTCTCLVSRATQTCARLSTRAKACACVARISTAGSCSAAGPTRRGCVEHQPNFLERPLNRAGLAFQRIHPWCDLHARMHESSSRGSRLFTVRRRITKTT